MRSPLCILASDKIALCFHSNTHSLSMSFSQRSSFWLSTMACMPAPHVCQAPVGCPGHWHYYLWESTAEKPIKNTGFVHVNPELAHTESRPYFLYYQIVLCFVATWRWRPHPLETVYCDGVFICSSLTDVFFNTDTAVRRIQKEIWKRCPVLSSTKISHFCFGDCEWTLSWRAGKGKNPSITNLCSASVISIRG